MLLPNVPLTPLQMETWEVRLTMTDWGGWVVVDSEIAAAAAEEEEMSHERERETERNCSVFVVHCRHLLVRQFERKGVCAQWQRGGVRYREILVLKRRKCPLVSDMKQPRTLAEKRLCIVPRVTLVSRMSGLHVTSSPSLHTASRRTEDDGIHYHEPLIWYWSHKLKLRFF